MTTLDEALQSAAVVPQAPVPIDAQEFRRCLSQFATGVTVITTDLGARPIGMTVNSFSSLSLDPPLILWSIARTSSRFSFFDAAESFAVNVLSERQTAVSRHFSTWAENKFADVAWKPGENGSPVLDGAAAVFECTRADSYDGGDHRIIIGRVTRAMRVERVPLLFSQGAYRVPADHPDDTPQGVSRPGLEVTDMEGEILSDLFRANHKLAARFVRFRGTSVTRDEHRVLISVERRPGLSRIEVAEYAFLGTHAADDALAGLLTKGLLELRGRDGLVLTEAGRERRRQLVGYLKEMEKELFAGVPAETVRAGRELLRHLAAD